MEYPIRDCDCEDFPCCIHADNFPPSDEETLYFEGLPDDDFRDDPPDEDEVCVECGWSILPDDPETHGPECDEALMSTLHDMAVEDRL